MLLGSLFTFLFAMAMLMSILVAHFGSHTAMFYIIRKVISKEIPLIKFIKEEIFQISTMFLVSFVVALAMLVISFGLLIGFLLPVYKEIIIDFLFIFGFLALGIGYGSLVIIRKDTGGMRPWRGTLAVFSGWLFLLMNVSFAFMWIWKAFFEKTP